VAKGFPHCDCTVELALRAAGKRIVRLNVLKHCCRSETNICNLHFGPTGIRHVVHDIRARIVAWKAGTTVWLDTLPLVKKHSW
jgi:hypothetical protein